MDNAKWAFEFRSPFGYTGETQPTLRCRIVERGPFRALSMLRRTARARAAGRGILAFGAPAKCVHQIDNLGGPGLAWHVDFFAMLFLAQYFFQRVLVTVLELLWMKVPGLCLDYVGGQFEHVLCDFFAWNIAEIVLLVANLVRITQRHSHHAFAARLKRDHMFA